MNNQHDISTDDEVSRLYKSCADESAPRHLDDAVLRQAASAVRDGTAAPDHWLRKWFGTTRRPLAIAAAMLLSVGIAVQYFNVTDTNNTGQMPLQAGSEAWPGQSSETPGLCTESQQQSVERWLGCIAELEKTGRVDDATDERRRMLRAFPETRLSN